MKTSLNLWIATLIAAVAMNPIAVGAGEAAVSGKSVAAEVYEGYFVSNKFEPESPTSFVVATDQASFDNMFGVARVMGDRSHRLPPGVFEKQIVIAAIHRGKAMVTYKLDRADLDGKTLAVRYAARSEPSTSAEFSCPLILSVPTGDYEQIQFIENGKLLKTVKRSPGPAFQIDSKNPVEVKATSAGGKTIFTIHDGHGIGGATIQRKDRNWPQTVIVRAQFRGLEKLTITSGNLRLSASVASSGEHPRLLNLLRDGKEGPQLKSDSAYWMEIRTLDADGKQIAGLPPEGGCFEMTIPKVLLNAAKEVQLNWVDFFR